MLTPSRVPVRLVAAALAVRVQPDGTIRISGCSDCGGIDAEVHQAGERRQWRLGREAASRLGPLVDRLVALGTTRKP